MPHLLAISAIKDEDLKSGVLEYFARDRNFCKALQELCENIIKGNVRVNAYKRRKLIEHRNNIYSIAFDKRISKKNIVQSGGWYWIIPIVISLLTQ